MTEAVGYVAGICTTFSAVPQIVKCYKSKSAADLSYLTLGLVETGLILWATYGILDKNYPIIVWNAVSILINTTLVAMKIRYDRSTENNKSFQLSSDVHTANRCQYDIQGF